MRPLLFFWHCLLSRRIRSRRFAYLNPPLLQLGDGRLLPSGLAMLRQIGKLLLGALADIEAFRIGRSRTGLLRRGRF